jgi:predicted ATPase
MSQSPLITELKIEGFKSFGTPAERLSLGRLNFVVGANASGKTNLISALRFIKNAVLQNIEFAVNEFGGVAEVRNKILREKTQPKPITISLKMETDIGGGYNQTDFRISNFSYTLCLDLRNESGVPEVASEEFTASLKMSGDKKSLYSLRRNKHEVEINDPMNKDTSRSYKVPEQEATRLALGVGFFSIPPVIFRSVIEDWRFYNISPHLARTPFKETPDVDLGPAGENLAVILHKLEQQNGKGALHSIIAGLKSAIPGFKGIKAMQLPVEGKWAFQLLEEKIRGAINPDSASDGTIRLLALMVIANWTTKQSSLVAIEEPENGVHPHLSEHIVQVLRTASEERQLLVTTHNPAFLDYLQPDEVILCDKINGFTQVQLASNIRGIETFRKHFRLGELWEQGTLGGIP